MQKVDGISEQLDFFRHFSVKNKKYPVQFANGVQFKTVRDILTFFLCKLRLWFQNIVEHISSLLLCR